jgi:hypothetical protein
MEAGDEKRENKLFIECLKCVRWNQGWVWFSEVGFESMCDLWLNEMIVSS